LGHWVIGSLGHWVIGSLGHWVIEFLADKIKLNTSINIINLLQPLQLITTPPTHYNLFNFPPPQLSSYPDKTTMVKRKFQYHMGKA
jgi:hypothetical protein